MALVEGIGDEVLVCAGVLLIAFLIIVAWLSTSIQDIPFINVIIIDRTHRNRTNHPEVPSNRNNNSTQPEPAEASSQTTPDSVRNENLDEQRLSASSNVGSPIKQATPRLDESSSPDVSVNDRIPEDAGNNDSSTDSASVSLENNTCSNSENGSSEKNHSLNSDTFNSEVKCNTDASIAKTGSDSGIIDECSNLTNTELSNSTEVGTSGEGTQEHDSSSLGVCSSVNLSGTELRRRRLAFFSSKPGDDVGNTTSTEMNCEKVSSKDEDQPDPISDEIIVKSEATSSVSSSQLDEDSQPSATNYVQNSELTLPTTDSGEPISTSGGAESIEAEVEVEGQQIRVRLKYLNDTQRQVVANPTDTIGNFRRTHFAPELGENKLVRFIFNGQDLRNDTSTLQAYNIVDNSVIHCLITQANRTQPQTQTDDYGEFDIGRLMFPLFAFILGVMWYLRFSYRQYFNVTTTLSLVGITFMFLMSYIASWNRRPREHLE